MSDVLRRAAEHAAAFLGEVGERHVGTTATGAELRAALGGPLPEEGSDPVAVIDALAAGADPGLVASQGGRFYGFVVGGALPVGVAADWLAAAWDQCAGFFVLSPAASALEEVVGGWLAELLDIPAGASFGTTTGCQMAHFTALAAARHHLLAERGWDVEARGLNGAPALRIVSPADRHTTVDRVLRFLGIGTDALVPVECDEHGRLVPEALERELARSDDATIVTAQAGNVNTGAFDPIGTVCELAHATGAWVHVDGAFGSWAAAAPSLRHLTAGNAQADSWAVDGHKWLNVPYDCGYVFCAHPDAHAASMTMRAAYLVRQQTERNNADWSADSSRRARVFATYAVLRALGRGGVAELIERTCAHARRFAEALGAEPGVEILNDVVLNQVLVRFGDSDGLTQRVIAVAQREGVLWLGGSNWRGREVARISVSGHATTEADVERSLAALRAAAGRAGA